MKIKINLIILTLIFCLNLNADIIPARDALKIYVDYARFFGDEEKIFLEIYYSFRTDQITLKKEANKFMGEVNISLELTKENEIAEKAEWVIPCILLDTTAIYIGKTMVGLKQFFVKPGEYTLKILAVDYFLPERRDSITIPLKMSLLPKDRDVLSDLELCSSIKQMPEEGKNIFYKNTLEVIPNASSLYGLGLPIIYYYLEAYNLLTSGDTEEYIIKATVNDAVGREIVTHEKVKQRINNSSVEIGTINTASLKGGTYNLKLALIDTIKRTAAISLKKFFVYRPGDIDSLIDLQSGAMVSTEYAVMNEEDLNFEFDITRYIATEEEKKQFEKLSDVDAKRKFLYDFWKRRDLDPMTGINEFKEMYMKRIDYSNQNFTSAFIKGWKSDRGRVYIVYGAPDDIERHPSSFDAEPYEIWSYHALQGGVIFIFGDRTGYGDYRLLHSTHREELQDESWYEKIQKAR